MPNIEIELEEVEFVTIGTVGPKGQRVFYLQAGQESQLVTLVIEKEQSWALSEAISELVDDLNARYDALSTVDFAQMDMYLRKPIEPVFRVAQMGLGYDEDRDRIVLVAQELVPNAQSELADAEEGDEIDLLAINADAENAPSVVRLWCSREQMHALSLHAMEIVKAGRADAKQNGRLIYYWT